MPSASIVAFPPGSRLVRGRAVESPLPVVRNGQPGTFVELPRRVRVSLPTDQIDSVDDRHGELRVGFAGMRFDGLEDGLLVFRRVRELWPEERLSPERGFVMRIDPRWVAAVEVGGREVWRAAG